MKNNNYVKIFDTTLRDGEQSPGFSMSLEEKIRMAVQLEKLGIDVIEAGFPAASPEDFESVKQIAQKLEKPEICGLARAMESDLVRTWEAIQHAQKPRIHTFIATSPIHMEHKLKKSPKQVVDMAVKAVKIAKSMCERVDFSPEDAGRSDRDFLVEIITATIEAGADTINIPDTVGYLTPDEFGELIGFLIKNVPNSDQVIFATHCHNDLGLAGANALAGVKNGARQIECTINGAGERAGNTALEEVVMALKTRADYYGLKTGINTQEISPSSHLLEQITGQKTQVNKAIVGRNAFAHESGIHQDGVLKHRETYEIMTPESIGLDKNEIVLGKHSGRAALKNHLEKMGYSFSPERLQEVFIAFKHLADQKKEITDADLDALMVGKRDTIERWKLINYEVSSSEKASPEAKITILDTTKNQEISAKNSGTGMVDAAYKSIEEICGKHGELIDFFMESVTSGLDAQAIVNVRLKTQEGKTITGKSGDTDIVKAAIDAYISAMNGA